MHCAILFFCMTLLVSPLLAQRKPDAAQQGLQGRVRSLRVEIQDGTQPQPRPELEQSFDPFGWQTEFKQYGPDGEVTSLNIFKRNGLRMIEADSTRYSPPEMAERVVTAFEEHGFPIQTTRYALDGTIRERIVTEYEETQIVERHYDGNDKLVSTRTISTLHDPDSPDRHIEQKVNGKPELATDIHRSESLTEIHQQQFGAQGEVQERSTRQIEPSGARAATLKADGSSMAYIRTLQCEDIRFRGNPSGGIHQRCDDQGNPVEETIDGPDGKPETTIRFSYVKDDHGNWTRRTAESFRGGKSTGKSVMMRTITYY